jgi:hypothetical protein
MRRDWSTPKYHEEADKYSATITFEKDVVPVYAWFDGRTRSQFMGETIWRREDGAIPMMAPVGDRDDKDAQIHPFKLHRGVLPLLDGKQWLIPLQVEEFFAEGGLEHAVAAGAKTAYGIDDPRYTWVETIRYMGINHEVVPAAQALQCLDCHRAGGRLDWAALGYDQDPLEQAFD